MSASVTSVIADLNLLTINTFFSSSTHSKRKIILSMSSSRKSVVKLFLLMFGCFFDVTNDIVSE